MPDTKKQIVDCTMTIAELRLSPLNVRTSEADTSDTSQLEALILADGLMYPMSVHQLRGSKTFGAFAGGRRYRSIKRLTDRGEVPADAQWKVRKYIGYSEAELIELSINENLPRRDLQSYEVYAGVRRAHSLGHDVGQIAEALNQKPVHIERWLRLGSLAKPVFAALAAGTITTDQARAFAGTADQQLQLAVFERLAPISIHSPTPKEIRAALNIGDARAQRELAFVGFDAYRAAGGRFELDLFAEEAEERGRVEDLGKLQQLVDEKIAGIRDEVRASTSRPDLRFIAEQPITEYKIVDHQLAITPRRLADGSLELPAGDVVAHIAIDASGAPVVSYWWESRKAKFGSERKPAAAPRAVPTPAAPAAESPFAGHHRAVETTPADDHLKSDALVALSALRKVILRAGLIDNVSMDEGVGLDLLVWSQARAFLRPGERLGIRTIANENVNAVLNDAFTLARQLVGATDAARICGLAIVEVSRQPFITDPDLGAAFAAYCEAHSTMKRRTAAIVAGMALDRSLSSPGYERPLHDEIARQVGIETDGCIRTYWAPTNDMLDLLPKKQRLEIAEPFVDRATIATWAKLKSSELTSGLLALLTRAGGKGASWVHPLLRFTTTQSQDVREAAE